MKLTLSYIRYWSTVENISLRLAFAYHIVQINIFKSDTTCYHYVKRQYKKTRMKNVFIRSDIYWFELIFKFLLKAFECFEINHTQNLFTLRSI